MSFKPTPEQHDIIEAIYTEPKVGVVAVPGSGKTTLTKAIANEYGSSRILYIVFNKANQIEARSEFPSNTTVTTVNSMGFQWYGVKKRGKNLQNLRPVMIKDILNEYSLDYDIASEVLKLFNEWCLSASTESTIKSSDENFPYLNDLAVRVGKENIGKLIRRANKLIELMRKEGKGGIDITHGFYMKEFHLGILNGEYKSKWDIIMMDEAQDASQITKAIFDAISALRKLLVGDPDQQLYSFLGAVNSLGNAIRDQGYKSYPLTNSFRMPQSVADEANRIISVMKGYDPDIKGLAPEIDDNVVIHDTAFISRTNSVLIRKVHELIKKDQENKTDTMWVTIRNPDAIFSLILELIFISSKIRKGFTTKEGINLKDFENKQLWFFARDFEQRDDRHVTDFISWMKRHYENDAEISGSVNLILGSGGGEDKIDFFDLKDQCKQRYQQYRKNPELFTIKLTTAHTSKGLEFDKVIITDGFKETKEIILEEFRKRRALKPIYEMVDKIINSEEMSEKLLAYNKLKRYVFDDGFYKFVREGNIIDKGNLDEIHLMYVAFSRAKKVLVHKGIDLDQDKILQKIITDFKGKD